MRNGKTALIVLGSRRLRGNDALGEKRRHRIGEYDLPHHALTVLVGAAQLMIPVALLSGAAFTRVMLLSWILVATAPLIEGCTIFGIEILSILGVAAAGVSVCGYQDVGLVSRCFLAAHTQSWAVPRNSLTSSRDICEVTGA